MDLSIQHIILVTLLSLLHLGLVELQTPGELSIDEAYLFDKSQRLDRVIIKHQIAYHFQQKAVKEVTQELFISRMIDLGPIVRGLSLLNQTAVNLKRYCELKQIKVDRGNDSFVVRNGVYNPFSMIGRGTYSYPEAKAKCTRLGKQLPEIYTLNEMKMLYEAAGKGKTLEVFAGIEYDSGDQVYRFISTGKPYWKGLYLFNNDTKKKMSKAKKSCGYKFVYAGSELKVYASRVYLTDDEVFGDFHYNITEFTVDTLICQDKVHETLQTRAKRALRNGSTVSLVSQEDPGSYSATDVSEGEEAFSWDYDDHLMETCKALVTHMTDFHSDTYLKIDRLLTLVDIDMIVQAQNADEVDRGDRKKRFASLLARVVFKKGTKLLWGLFGFWQQVRLNRQVRKNTNKLKDIDKSMEDVKSSNRQQQKDIDEGRRRINEATQLLKEQSVMLGDLVVATKDLRERVKDMETHMKHIETEIDVLKDQMTIMTTIMMLSILTSRVTLSLDNGYEQLSEIIHTSLLSQTSPLVLPLAQIEEVQKKLAEKSITAMLDKDYSKMRSVVTADPSNSGYLLVIVNAVAVSHQKLELIKLTPIPFYDDEKGYYPILDYQYAALNQLANTFTVLSEEEAQSCIEDRCYISQMEQTIYSQSCGMPQFQDHAVDACDTESIMHDGMFIRAANPDGVIFSFRKEVKTQMFCKNNDQILAPRKMSGAGVMFVPPGCVLNAVNKEGRVVKVKGGPSSHLIEISNIDLTTDPLLGIPNAEHSIEEGVKKPSSEKAMEHQLLIVQQSMDATHKHVSQLQKKIWITTGCFIAILALIVAGIAVLYRYSKRFQHRFKKVVGGFAVLRDRFEEIDVVRRDVASLSTAVVPFRSTTNICQNRPRSTVRLGDIEAREYVHLDNQTRMNQRSPAELRTYDKLPVKRVSKRFTLPAVAPRTVPPLLRVHSMYPTCPEKDAEESDVNSSCQSLGQLSLVARFGTELKAIQQTDDELTKSEKHE